VAPVLKRGQMTRSVYLPEGLWRPFNAGAALAGGKLHQVSFGLADVPAFARDVAIVPRAAAMQSTNDYALSPITLMCYGADGQGTFFEDDARSVDNQSGSFNKWRLEVKTGEFDARPAHLGYNAPSRLFALNCSGKSRPVTLPRT